MNQSSTAYIALGSNLGDKEGNLKRAVKELSETPGIRVTAVSSFYKTAPVGYTDQPDFVNAVIEIETTLSVRELLNSCLSTENNLGRVRTIRWGPRVIDIDILLYDDLKVSEEDLEIPHPRMLEREFVIEPLSEIAPDLVLPNKKTALEQLQELRKTRRIE